MAGEINFKVVQGGSLPSTVSRAPTEPRVKLPIEEAPVRTTNNEEGNSQPEQADRRSLASEVALRLATKAQNVQRDLKFTVDDNSGETVINVIDTITKEVIRRIPFDDYEASNLSDSLKGAIFNNEV